MISIYMHAMVRYLIHHANSRDHREPHTEPTKGNHSTFERVTSPIN